MISEKDLAELEGVPYEERIARVEKLLEGKSEPRPFELGLLLALKMGQELRQGKELGSESGDLVASWVGKYSEWTVEEAIASAKEFLTNPGALVEKMKAGFKKKAEEAEAAAKAAAENSSAPAAGEEIPLSGEVPNAENPAGESRNG